MTNCHVEVRILGPLEIAADGEEVALGGAKQRAVLAALLLRAGEVVPVERLIDEVWGDDPPPSAPHTLESYISRLRQRLNGYGPSLSRRGAGYSIDLGDAVFDAVVFGSLHESASRASAIADDRSAVTLAREALALWRGPVLADVALSSAGRAEAERLDELRLRTHELRLDAELALGHHEEIVGELQSLAAQNAYRERFLAQLMLALYRSGRHAEALEVYERTRRCLDEDLGLQPSAELQGLSGRIVRQDPSLERLETSIAPQPSAGRLVAHTTRRVAVLTAIGAVAAAIMALSAAGSTPEIVPGDASALVAADRIALVIPEAPEAAAPDDVRVRETAKAFAASSEAWDYEATTFVLDDAAPTTREVARVTEGLGHGAFDLVVVLAGGAGEGARSLVPFVQRHRRTRFVFVDASLVELGLNGTRNATGIRFAEEQSIRLAGYMSGLVRRRDSPDRADVVSIVAATGASRAGRAARAFRQGLRDSGREVKLLVGVAESPADKSRCEHLANSQIDAGSDIVLAMGGACAHAAAAVAATRGVWGIVRSEDRVRPGPHVLASSGKWFEKATRDAVDDFKIDRLPAGGDVTLTLANDYAVDLWGKAPATEPVWSRVVELCSRMREHSENAAP